MKLNWIIRFPWNFAWFRNLLSCGSHSWTLWKKFFGSKNLGDGPKTGIFEFIENVGTWYKSRKIKNWSKMF